MHSLLKRQLKRYLGGLLSVPEQWQAFTSSVNDAYLAFDDDRKMLENSLNLSSQELLEANSEMRAVFQAIPDLVFRLNHQGAILDIKAGADIDLMVKRRELIGKRIQDVPHPNASQQFMKAIHRVVLENAQTSIEYSVPLQGDDSHFEARLVPLPGNQIVAIVRNITAKKQAQATALQLAAIVESSNDAIIGNDLNGIITSWNHTAERIFGFPAEEVLGTSIMRLIPVGGHDEESKILGKIRGGETLENLETLRQTRDGRLIDVSVTISPVKGVSGDIVGVSQVSRSITRRKRAEAELKAVHVQLLEASRQAGMAEIATNVLHNVGNVLNSVNVSVSIVVDNVKTARAASLGKVVALFREHENDLGAFFSGDAKGKQILDYLSELSNQVLIDQKANVEELDSLFKNVEHIKTIVAAQQDYTKAPEVKEVANISELLEDGLRMNVCSLARNGVEVIREYEHVSLVRVEKHKLLQVLVNLIRNADNACYDSQRQDKQMTVRLINADGLIKISVIDNGVGIPPENLTRIFNHGFTTRKDGHGFGLHSGALAAKEMGGALIVHSDGAGQGATFTLEFPCDLAEITP